MKLRKDHIVYRCAGIGGRWTFLVAKFGKYRTLERSITLFPKLDTIHKVGIETPRFWAMSQDTVRRSGDGLGLVIS
jgi:hypothetical protein